MCAVWNWLVYFYNLGSVGCLGHFRGSPSSSVGTLARNMVILSLIPVISLSAEDGCVLREHGYMHPGCCEWGCTFLNLRNLHSWSVGSRWHLALLNQPPLCQHLEEVPACPFISFSCSDTGALAGVDGVRDMSRLSPDVLGLGFTDMASVCCHLSPPLSTVGPV